MKSFLSALGLLALGLGCEPIRVNYMEPGGDSMGAFQTDPSDSGCPAGTDEDPECPVTGVAIDAAGVVCLVDPVSDEISCQRLDEARPCFEEPQAPICFNNQGLDETNGSQEHCFHFEPDGAACFPVDARPYECTREGLELSGCFQTARPFAELNEDCIELQSGGIACSFPEDSSCGGEINSNVDPWENVQDRLGTPFTEQEVFSTCVLSRLFETDLAEICAATAGAIYKRCPQSGFPDLTDEQVDLMLNALLTEEQ